MIVLDNSDWLLISIIVGGLFASIISKAREAINSQKLNKQGLHNEF